MDDQFKKAQEYLVVRNGEEVKVILDIEVLAKRYAREDIAGLLLELFCSTASDIKDLVEIDRSSSQIDHQVARLFRLRMALDIITEEVSPVGTERGTGKGG